MHSPFSHVQPILLIIRHHANARSGNAMRAHTAISFLPQSIAQVPAPARESIALQHSSIPFHALGLLASSHVTVRLPCVRDALQVTCAHVIALEFADDD